MPTEAAYFSYVKRHAKNDDIDAESSTGKAEREETIKEVVSVLDRWVGDRWDDITRDNDDLHLVQISAAADGQMPWDQVIETSEDWHEYVLEKQDAITM